MNEQRRTVRRRRRRKEKLVEAIFELFLWGKKWRAEGFIERERERDGREGKGREDCRRLGLHVDGDVKMEESDE